MNVPAAILFALDSIALRQQPSAWIVALSRHRAHPWFASNPAEGAPTAFDANLNLNFGPVQGSRCGALVTGKISFS